MSAKIASPHDANLRDHTPAGVSVDIEAERALLGILLYENAAFRQIGNFLQSKHFYEPLHGRLFGVIEDCARRGTLAEPILIARQLQGDPTFIELGGMRYLADLVDRAPKVDRALHYAQLIYDAASSDWGVREGEVRAEYGAPENSERRPPLIGSHVTAHTIQELLGGEGIVGRLASDLDIAHLIRKGLPTKAVDHFMTDNDIKFGAIENEFMPLRTFKRRKSGEQPLDPVEADRFLRLVRLVAAADQTFGNSEKGRAWLLRKNQALGGEAPLSLADTDHGARSVEALLGRIAHGIAA